MSTSAVKRIALASLVPRPNSARKIPPPDPHRNPDQASQPEENRGTFDCIRHSAAFLARRLRNLHKERQIQRTGALVKKVNEDGDQGRYNQHRGERGHPRRERVGQRSDL